MQLVRDETNFNAYMQETEAHSIVQEAEQSVLGALLKDPDAFDRIAHIVSASDFYLGDHALIFAELERLALAGKRADAITVAEALGDRAPGVMGYLFEIEAASGGAARVTNHAQIVRNAAMRRKLGAAGIDLQADAKNGSKPVLDVLADFAQRLDAIGQCRDAKEPAPLSATFGRYADLLNARMDGLIRPVATGFRDLDKRLSGGLERGTLTVIAGRPAMGKTAAALAIARNMAVSGVSLVLSMEMAEHQISDRNVAALGYVPLAWLRQPRAEDTHLWKRMEAAFLKSAEMRLFVDDETNLSVADIRAKARSMKRKHGLDALLIDQLSFIRVTSKQDNTSYAIGEITRGLVALAKELDIAVVLLAQLNRACESRPDRRPIMADLATSGSIEQDAAVIMFLYRDEVYNSDTPDKGICEIGIAKNRQGSTGRVGLRYEELYTRFSDTEQPWQPTKVEVQKRGRGYGPDGGLK